MLLLEEKNAGSFASLFFFCFTFPSGIESSIHTLSWISLLFSVNPSRTSYIPTPHPILIWLRWCSLLYLSLEPTTSQSNTVSRTPVFDFFIRKFDHIFLLFRLTSTFYPPSMLPRVPSSPLLTHFSHYGGRFYCG